MKNLYFVSLYNHSLNTKTRYLVTAKNLDMADVTALIQAGNGWKVEYSEFVCLTPDNVCKEA